MLRLRAPISRAQPPASRAAPARPFSSAPSRHVTVPTRAAAVPIFGLLAAVVPKVAVRSTFNVVNKTSANERFKASGRRAPFPLLGADAASWNMQFPLLAAAAATAALLLLSSDEAEAETTDVAVPLAVSTPELVQQKPLSIPKLFQESRPMNWYEYTKLAIGVLYLIPIRLTLFAPLFTLAWCLAKLSILGLQAEEISKPRAAWRRLLLRPLPYIVRAAMFIFGFYRVHTHGQLAPGSSAPIVVSNHLSFIDPLVLMAVFPESNFVAKREIASVPFFGTFMKALQCILVVRESDSSRRSAISGITSRTTAHPGEYPQLVIFPEGTTTNGTSLIEFRHGAFTPGLPVQPLVIRYPNRYCDPASPRAGQNVIVKFLRIASQFVNHLDITFLPVYTPNPQEASNPAQYAENVRSVIATAAGATLAPFTYFDAIRFARI